MTDLPTALREWRGDYTAERAAEILGVSRRTYEGWEQGRCAGNSAALLRWAILTPAPQMAEIAQGSNLSHHPKITGENISRTSYSREA